MSRPTIFALASGRPPAAIAVIRLSGARAHAAVAALCGRARPDRILHAMTLRDAPGAAVIDHGMAVCFAAPRTATGEDTAELHVHGGGAVVAALLAALGRLPGLQLAEAGEFTRRAFENGRMDLTQVEGLADLVAATTEAQRLQAQAQSGGALARQAEAWREVLLRAMVESAALLDFAEEQFDVRPADDAVALRALAVALDAAIAAGARGERIRDGLTVAIVGAVNVGKSSLFNRLAHRDAAIVSAHAGTTRDPIEVALDLGGQLVVLVDTAGVRVTDDPVEMEGIARAAARAARADLVVEVVDEDRAAGAVTVVNKIDRLGLAPGAREGRHYLSARSGDGVAAFEDWLTGWAAATVGAAEPAIVTRARQMDALRACRSAVGAAIDERDLVLRSEALRVAAAALERLTGRIGVEDVLDRLFASFCIGK